ncbi:MAG: response regulator [Salinibacter sp.]|uniref:response regulator n=1 Tax=Salinibacter sp. TaxID=2065818 RepID=UPI0035D4C9ED
MTTSSDQDAPEQGPPSDSERERPVRILLVEDNPADVRLTREMLRESKVRNDLMVAHTAEEAEDILGLTGEDERPRPDLVLLDLDLPVKSGHDLLQEMKSHPTLRRVPVIVLTSSEAEEDVVKSYDEHANAYVTKPVDLDEITTIVQSVDEFWFQVVRLPEE